MKIRTAPLSAAGRGELVFVLVTDGGPLDAGRPLHAAVQAAKAAGDLKTAFRSTSVFHQPPKSPCKRLGFVGLGKPDQVESQPAGEQFQPAFARAPRLRSLNAGGAILRHG